jgi:hypothetical protein
LLLAFVKSGYPPPPVLEEVEELFEEETPLLGTFPLLEGGVVVT